MAKKICKRCHREFQCMANEIAVCQCTNIQLSEDIKQYLAREYDDCLCLSCLIEISQLQKEES